MKTIFCNESGEYIIYESDRHGFQNPNDVWDRPQMKLLVLGDSFAQGACVPTEDNTVSLLRSQIPGTLNLGASGNGPLRQIAGLREYGATYEPDVVLWFYFEGNDLGDLLQEASDPLLQRYLQPQFLQHLEQRQPEIDAYLTGYVDGVMAQRKAFQQRLYWASLRLFNVRRLIGLTREQPSNTAISVTDDLAPPDEAVIRHGVDPVLQTGLDLFEQVLSLAQDSISQWDGELYLVYLPAYTRYEPDSQPSIHYRNHIVKRLEEMQISVIDLHPIFATQPEPRDLFPFGLNGHYTPRGYALVAEAIMDGIAAQQ